MCNRYRVLRVSLSEERRDDELNLSSMSDCEDFNSPAVAPYMSNVTSDPTRRGSTLSDTTRMHHACH
ncbi:hypothetical protein BC629DRAFT_1540590 [Irpex lacteus]|nr:hypothetical protein BC629DRAFT_1540590 [Irpex lacteus]